MKYWIKQQGKIGSLFFDITSRSKYSKLLEYVEFGYNRDDEKLPQINLGIIYAESTNLPIYYQI